MTTIKRKSTIWNNRIVGHDNVAPDKLLANPLNWRTHGDFQQQSLKGILKDVGIVQSVIVNKTTGHIVDGHLRVQLALREKQPSIPVVYVELTPAEEAEVLATLDPIGALAGRDEENLGKLMELIDTDNDAVINLLEKIGGNKVDDIETEAPEIQETFSVLVDCDGEAHQKKLLAELKAKGFKCRALIT